MTEKKTRIFRKTKSENYTVIHNEILRRDDLSWKAKGIMCYILSLPNDWEIYLEEIRKHGTEGRDSFRKGWNELESKGYVKRVQERVDGKFLPAKTFVFETSTFTPCTEKPSADKPCTDKPSTENPTLLSTDNTKYLNKQNTVKDNHPLSRHKYGQYKNVLLTDKELSKLKEEFPVDWKERIESVSEYVATSGRKYKNFLAVIRSWARQEKQRNNFNGIKSRNEVIIKPDEIIVPEEFRT